jgi:hypothetical protein
MAEWIYREAGVVLCGRCQGRDWKRTWHEDPARGDRYQRYGVEPAWCTTSFDLEFYRELTGKAYAEISFAVS